jgi:putative nucleotidyltransferase with HDIG domain
MGVGTLARETAYGPRWRARPAWARGVRTLALAVPIGVGVGVATVASHVLAHPRPGTLPWYLAVLALATAASTAVAPLARRLLPLATLLKLSLAFPDHTPSRFKVALRAGSTGRLHRRVEQIRDEGMDADAATAAETVLFLATALNAHDRKTRGHSERVRALAELIAAELHLPEDDLDRLRWAALLHDCGKLLVHTDVLNKTGPLSDEEWDEVRRHPLEGARLVAPLHEFLGDWAHTIEQHHERWDGGGYPHGTAGADLALGARIVSVADTYDVMTSARSYNTAVSADDARRELAAQAGSQFDPEVVRAFLAVSIGRLRWVTGPISWLFEFPFIRTAAHAPVSTAPAALTALTLAIASAVGVLSPPDRGGAAGVTPVEAAAPSRDAVAAAPTTTAVPLPPREVSTEVLGTQIEAPAPPSAPEPDPSVGGVPASAAPGTAAELPRALPSDDAGVCLPEGVVSGLVDSTLTPVAGALAPPLGDAVDAANCGVLVPVEGLLDGLLDHLG